MRVRRRGLCGVVAVAAAVTLAVAVAGEVGTGVTPEGQQTRTSLVTFLGAEEARAAIVDDSMEPYFDKLQVAEMAAKTGSPVPGGSLDEKRAECRRRYQAAALEFSAQEKEALEWYVSRFQPALEKDYPLVAWTPWSFLKVADNIEGGLPHTRGRHVVLAQGLVSELTAARQTTAGAEAGAVLQGIVLVHEKVHVVQRAHPGLFDNLYTEVWGFRRATVIDECPWLVEHQIVNPDATDCGWVFPLTREKGVDYICPRVLLARTEGIPLMPADFREVAIAVEPVDAGFRVRVGTGGRPLVKDARQVREYCDRFPPSTSIYHPAEAAADAFTRIVAYDAFAPKDRLPQDWVQRVEEVYAPLRRWFRENLKQAGPRPAETHSAEAAHAATPPGRDVWPTRC